MEKKKERKEKKSYAKPKMVIRKLKYRASTLLNDSGYITNEDEAYDID